MPQTVNNYISDIPDFFGMRITVMGLGLFGGGVEVVQFLAKRGACITVTDLKDENSLRPSIEKLKQLDNITFHLGSHMEKDFTDTDLVMVSPAIPKSSPFLMTAANKNIPFETEMNLFFKLCGGTIIGVTGSSGKTTTTALLDRMVHKKFPDALVGGNIGQSLLGRAETIKPGTLVILELSSFQLEDLGYINCGPEHAIVTNLSPNHLDRHGTFDEYVEAKKAVYCFQTENGITVLNADDACTRALEKEVPGKVRWFSLTAETQQGAFLKKGMLKLACAEGQAAICNRDELLLPGDFNIGNILAAASIASELGVPVEDIREAATSFPGVPHRLEFIGEFRGVRVYNDSIATTAERTIAALKTVKGNKILIVGGSDKGLDYSTLAREAALQKVKVITMGAIGPKICAALSTSAVVPAAEVDTLEQAVIAAFEIAEEGDSLLLSPATASYDAFENFVYRGEEFKRLVEKIAGNS